MPKPTKPKKAEKDDKPKEQIVAQNRAASYNYHLLERYEAGLVLHGTEVKALREGKANIRDAYVDFKPTGPWLVNAHIAQYMPGGPWNHEPLGSRKLLLHKNEITGGVVVLRKFHAGCTIPAHTHPDANE